MTVSRRDVLKALAATAALRAFGASWPIRELSAQAPSGRMWVNKHRNLSEQIWRHYDVWNHGPAGAVTAPEWRGGFAHLSSIVNDAQAAGRRVRAVGAGWSLSPWAVCPDVMINTMPLNFHTVGVAADDLSSSAFDPARMVFAQCGTSVRELSETLESRGLSLPTSGASNGQTICGAISTGTHGSARRVGSMQDFILGMHVLAEDGKQYWIERASVAGGFLVILRAAGGHAPPRRPAVSSRGCGPGQLRHHPRGDVRGSTRLPAGGTQAPARLAAGRTRRCHAGA
jgi:FAD/FMN-containing dehydrogenase